MKLFLKTCLNIKIMHISPPSITQNMDVPIHYQTIFRQPNENALLLFSKYSVIAKWQFNHHSVLSTSTNYPPTVRGRWCRPHFCIKMTEKDSSQYNQIKKQFLQERGGCGNHPLVVTRRLLNPFMLNVPIWVQITELHRENPDFAAIFD